MQARTAQAEDAVEKEAAKGYNIAFVGIDQPISATAPRFEEPLQALVAAFDGPVAIVLNGGALEPAGRRPAQHPGADRRQRRMRGSPPRSRSRLPPPAAAR